MNYHHFLNHISISKKLSLFLIIPLATLLFFATSSINDKQQQLNGTQNTLHFSIIVNQLSELVYQLQKERGLSAGIFGSQGKIYHTRLTEQRQETDSTLQKLTFNAIHESGYETNELRVKLDYLTAELDSINTTRRQIDQLIDNQFFALYSQLISDILNVISFMPSLNSTYELNNLSSSYIELLWLEELSGQERGALNGVFSAQEFSADQFTDISSYISGQQAAIRNFHNIASPHHQQLLNTALDHPSDTQVKHFREIVLNRAVRQDTLNGLQELIGYGGLIHNFKNRVIRNEQVYADRFQKNFQLARKQINLYRNLPNIDAGETAALNTIEDTFKRYQSQLATITKLKSQNLSIRYIDKIIKIDDEPAIAAINFLRHTISTHDPESWWQQASERLNLIHQVSLAVIQDLNQSAQTIAAQTTRLLNLYLLLTFLVVLFVSLIGLTLRSRLVNEIKTIAKSMRYSEQSHDYNQLTVTGNDEISDMARAFNSLIHDRSENEEQLRLAARVFSDTHEGIIITDDKGIIIDVNPTFTELTGYQPDEIIGKNPSFLSSGHHDDTFYADMWHDLATEKFWQGEIWNRKKDGSLYAELITITAIEDEHGQLLRYIGIFSDVTQTKQQQEKLQLMAHYDVLTELPNRALFVDRFSQAMAHSQRSGSQLAVCFLDLDNFKPINDNFGHKVGDQLLIEVAKRISSTIRAEDTVSRQGGDEFALLLGDIESASQCDELLKRLHSVLAQPYLIDGSSVNISASSGATIYPTDNADLDTLLRHADQAMYQAKQAGKNHHLLFNVQQDKQIIQQHLRLDEIEHALNNNEFTLYYQPKVNMITGHVFGVEALIRWCHPERGLIPPLDFLPIIEDTELEIHVGNWVIKQALNQLEQWQQDDIQLELSINIASHHLQSEHFIAELDTALAQHPAINSQCLQLEILESSALGDLSTVSSIIKNCQNILGVHVALDDFGTGYSSLTHLRNLSATTIKIDQSFVRDMLDDPSDYAIIDGVIGLANAFRRAVIAEGVESTNHGLLLMIMGCEQAQGYCIAKPMPADEVSKWLHDYQPNQAWLDYGKQQLSIKENKIKLFRLVTQHWLNRFIDNVQSPTDTIETWPIMKGQNDHCGQWLQREKQEKIFGTEGLNRLDSAHSEFHYQALEVQLKYHNGDIESARSGLVDLQTAYDKMSNVLGMCE